MTTEGFWPGKQPAQAEQDEHAAPAPQIPRNGDQPAAAAHEAPGGQPEGQEAAAEPEAEGTGHARGALVVPEGVETIEGDPDGAGRTVAIVVSRFNGEVTNKLLESALSALAAAGVPADRITVMPVPGAFELPLAAMALAKTRRFACIVALGCVIRGETAHFDYVAGEAASGLQLSGLETGIPVAFGVLTVDTPEQALARVDKGGEAVSSALEMADLFTHLRASAKAAS